MINGADKIYINSALYENKNLISKIASIFGSQSIVGGINLVKSENKYLISEKNIKKLILLSI